MTLRGQKSRSQFFYVKYVKNGKSYDVGPNEDYVDSSSLDHLPKIFGLLVNIIIIIRYHVTNTTVMYLLSSEIRCTLI